MREWGLQTRVIACTGTLDPERLSLMEALGPDTLLRKPIRPAGACRACEAAYE